MTCHCFIRHANTPDEREAAGRSLERARKLGDTQGIIIAVASLTGKCPARKQTVVAADETPVRSLRRRRALRRV